MILQVQSAQALVLISSWILWRLWCKDARCRCQGFQAFEESPSRKIAADAQTQRQEIAFHEYSRHLVRDLEGKGILCTSVETCKLVLSADKQDEPHAECIRSFPSVDFPAMHINKSLNN